MRISSSNRLFLFVNVVFLAGNFIVLFNTRSANWSGRGLRDYDAIAQATGMDLHLAQHPFALFVSKEFPKDDSFMFHRDGRELVLLLDDAVANLDVLQNENAEVSGSGPLRNVLLGLGDAVDVSIDFFDSGLDDYEIRELTLKRTSGDSREVFVDYLADGSFDLFMQMNTKTFVGQNKINFQGKWQDVEGIERTPDCYRTALANGDEVTFDPETGQWALVND